MSTCKHIVTFRERVVAQYMGVTQSKKSTFRLFNPEDGDATFLRHAGHSLSLDKTQHAVRLASQTQMYFSIPEIQHMHKVSLHKHMCN